MSDKQLSEQLRRSRIYGLSKDKLLEFLSADRDRWFQCLLSEPLPGDAVVTAIQYDFAHDAFLVRVTSRAFEAVPEGLVYPDYGPIAINVRVAQAYAPGPIREPVHTT